MTEQKSNMNIARLDPKFYADLEKLGTESTRSTVGPEARKLLIDAVLSKTGFWTECVGEKVGMVIGIDKDSTDKTSKDADKGSRQFAGLQELLKGAPQITAHLLAEGQVGIECDAEFFNNKIKKAAAAQGRAGGSYGTPTAAKK